MSALAREVEAMIEELERVRPEIEALAEKRAPDWSPKDRRYAAACVKVTFAFMEAARALRHDAEERARRN